MVWTDREMVQFSGGSGYCISAVTSGTRCTNGGSTNLLVLVFVYNCASFLPSCLGCVEHEWWFGFINHINVEPLTVSRVFLIYFFILFRNSEFNLQVWWCVFSVFYSCLNLSRNLVILHFIRPAWLRSLNFQFPFFAALSAHRLWIDRNEVYFVLW